jgi:hypothetical protein
MSPVAACLAVPGLGALALSLGASLAAAALLAYAFVLAALAGPASQLAGPPVREGVSGSGSVPPAAAPLDAGTAARAAAIARGLVGRPYVWGGADPASGVDCSGLVQWSFRQVGASVPRTAQQQFDATGRVGAAELRPGDLVFFAICCQAPDLVTHVGVYVGAGQMVHAPAPGESVRVESITTPYWRAHWAGAGRVAGAPATAS